MHTQVTAVKEGKSLRTEADLLYFLNTLLCEYIHLPDVKPLICH